MGTLRGDLRNEGFAVANEWRLDDTRIELFVAHVDRNGFAGRDADGDAGERDRLRERRRESAAGDLAAAFGGENFLVAAQHAALALKDQADLLLLYRRGGERRLADEIARAFEIDRPGEPALERSVGFGHVLTVEIHAGFQPQRIARTESTRSDARCCERIPQPGCPHGRQRDFESILAGIAGPGDETIAKLGRHER